MNICGYEVKDWLLQSGYNKPGRIALITDLVKELETAGMALLCNNFFAQNDADRALDLLLEMWLGRQLSREPVLDGLVYEPPPKLPDFRFNFEATQFNLEVKRIVNFENEIAKRTFLKIIRNDPPLKKPWLINLEMSDSFSNQHFNEFIRYLKQNQDKFEPTEGISLHGDYYWPPAGDPLIRFSFYQAIKGTTFGLGHYTHDRSGSITDDSTASARKAILAQLKKSSNKFDELSPTVANFVVIQPSSGLYLNDHLLSDVLYGTEMNLGPSEHPETKQSGFLVECTNTGIFKPDTFSKIAGVILVDISVDLLRENLQGMVFPNPRHIKLSQAWPHVPLQGITSTDPKHYTPGRVWHPFS